MCSSSLVYAESYPLELKFRLGQGKVTVEVLSPELKKEDSDIKSFLEKFEVLLLTDDYLAPVVIGSQVNEYILIQSFDSKVDFATQMEKWKELLTAKVQSQIPGAYSVQGIITEGERKIVMGSHLQVSENEVLEEIVVIAGSADIHGQVEKLVIIGGRVRLFSTAKVLKELNTIGGHLEVDPGAVVTGKSVSVGMPMSDESWGLLFKNIKDSKVGQFFRSDVTQFLLFLVKILALMSFAVVGYYVAPSYQLSVLKRLSSQPGQSVFWGFISLILVIPTTIILALSVIGLPIMPLQLTLYFLFFVYGYIQSANFIFSFISNKIPIKMFKNYYLSIFMGLLCLELLSKVPVLGDLLKWTIIFMGFGAASKVFYAYLFSPPSKKLSLLKSI
jgi:cytoskeletal protein CcmA (bactofilin family)